VLRRIEDLVHGGTDFAFETTLSGRGYAHQIRKMRARGYVIALFYLWIPSPDLALERIRERVAPFTVYDAHLFETILRESA
jgi:predicted ABC-type ATPase